MMPWAREAVDQAERVLIESVMDSGWTWEQLGAFYGERSKQAMQQHYKRRGGQRSWPASRRQEPDPSDVESVRRAITGLLLNFRATDEALTRTMADASWNERDPEKEARRLLSWTERLNDSMDGLNDFINNRISQVPRVDRPLVLGERNEVHPDHLEIERGIADDVRAELDRVLERLQEHRDTVDGTIDELRRRRAELG
ncbi:hypothetical protein SAMN05192558_105362 [Actinokineospora alba]|uniref:Myb-like DNA-binding domain-containing protein n=2 Tax=Actinokineospora alba TaxID=504798 RepID=A0A1H0NI84_9PSEU|nr:hypothetical protein C8E96_4297 [Actinokineospora alba]SDH85437.1 hypothetical protein SAMN05421871_102412 [Actinokineospora alba]SDO92487.1 hypothetical protein SAMN05192558_105362 [Actinokineospora alba]